MLVNRRILLADADAFFVAVARLVDPEGAGRTPLLIVGGSRESRGVVCSASYEARQYGVRSAMSIARALRLCPEATCVPVPRRECVEKSGQIRSVLGRYAPTVEGASIDEWYMDLGGTERLYNHEPLDETARRMRDAVVAETGLSVSIGGGTSKLIAKLAVERAKPKPGSNATGTYIVTRDAERCFLESVALADVPLIGPRFQERLARLGMTTVPHVLQHDLATLTGWLGGREAEWLYHRVRGIDRSPVESGGEAKCISRDETFSHDIAGDDALERQMLALVTRAASDLRSEGLAARTITVRIRDHDFTTRQASRTVDAPVISDRVILQVAHPLLRKLRSARRVPARLIGVSLSSLAPDASADQLTLFELHDSRVTETDRDRVIARTVDRVRKRFGADGIIPARLLDR